MKAGLPADSAHLEFAKTEGNFSIQDLWGSVHSKYRHSRSTINLISGADEYTLNKYLDEFVQNTLQGPLANPRFLEYKEPEEFFRLIRIAVTTSGSPFIYTFGDLVGFDQQLLTATTPRAFSALASKTSGSVNVYAGQQRVTSNADLFTLNDVGLRLKRSGDSLTYKIGKYVNAREIQLLEKYRGSTGADVAYKIGDAGIHVNVSGFVGGEIDSEDVELDGSNVINFTKNFNTLVSISKSDRTGGKISVQDSTGVLALGTLAPGETEIERQTVLLWPKPSSAETLTYRFFMKHPWLWLDTDRLLLRGKWHSLVCYKLERKLRETFGKDVPQGLIDDITKQQTDFENESEDLSMTPLIPDGEERYYGDQFNYDHITSQDFS